MPIFPSAPSTNTIQIIGNSSNQLPVLVYQSIEALLKTIRKVSITHMGDGLLFIVSNSIPNNDDKGIDGSIHIYAPNGNVFRKVEQMYVYEYTLGAGVVTPGSDTFFPDAITTSSGDSVLDSSSSTVIKG